MSLAGAEGTLSIPPYRHGAVIWEERLGQDGGVKIISGGH